MMDDPEGWMRQILARRREEGTFRELRTPEQDRCFVDFTSNDYLGLGRAADLRQAAELEAERARKVCLWSVGRVTIDVYVRGESLCRACSTISLPSTRCMDSSSASA